MHKLTIAIVLGFALVAFSQERVTKVVPPKRSLRVARLHKGIVEGRTYKNASLGLELTPPPELEFGTPELKGTPGTVPLIVTVSAWGEQKWSPIRNGTIFYADALAYYPDGQRSTEAYVHKVDQANQKQGFQRVGESHNGNLGGVSFTRVDFRSGPIYEAVFVKACDIQALVFIFTSSDRGNVNRLISETELKLDTSRSGCSLGVGLK